MPMNDLQRELDECKRLKTAIFEASSDGLAILDANGRFLDVNRAWERIMGMSRAEVLVRQRNIEEAVSTAAQAVVAASEISSSRITARIGRVRAELARYSDQPTVAEFLD